MRNIQTFMLPFESHIYKTKQPAMGGLLGFGGDGGIRTPGRCYPPTDFESASLRPLRYISQYCPIIIIDSRQKCKHNSYSGSWHCSYFTHKNPRNDNILTAPKKLSFRGAERRGNPFSSFGYYGLFRD